MCGLVGMVGFLEPAKHKNVMRDLLFLNTLRGKDSTGLSIIDRKKNVFTRKMTVPGYEFIEYPAVDRVMHFGDQLWLGHNRFKTLGSVSRANAHPFEVLDDEGYVMLVGAHNGTLDNKWELDKELKGDKFDTDSEALFNLLADKPNTKEAVKLLRGAWSLSWWDATTDCFHLLRNDKRPMTYAYSKDRKVFLYASEAWMLINAARRNGLELDQNARGMSCYSTTEDSLYTLEIPQEPNKELPDLKKEGGYSGAPSREFQKASRWKGYTPWWDDKDPNQEREKAPTTGSESRKAEGQEKKIITLGEPPASSTVRGFLGENLSHEAFHKIRERGCVWCGDAIKDSAFAFLAEDAMTCMNCIYDNHPKSASPPLDYEDIDENEDFLDDDLPFDLTDKQENSEEGRQLINAALGSARVQK